MPGERRLVETTPDVFRVDAPGRYLRGRTWLLWSWSTSLGGLALWGRPDVEDARAVVGAFDLSPGPRPDPVDLLVDARRMSGVEPAGFAQMAAGMGAQLPVWNQHVRRMVVVLPEGWVGAVVAGLQHIVAPGYAWQACANLDAALAVLNRPEARDASAAVATLVDELTAEEPLVARLRAWPGLSARDSTIQDAALELAVSTRTLQRVLAQAGTSFRTEAIAARRALAERLLVDTDDKLESIARVTGHRSLQHFSTQFRRWSGVTPSEYRARARVRIPR